MANWTASEYLSAREYLTTKLAEQKRQMDEAHRRR